MLYKEFVKCIDLLEAPLAHVHRIIFKSTMSVSEYRRCATFPKWWKH